MLVVNTSVVMNLVCLVMHLVLLNFGWNMMVLQLSLYYHDNSTDGGMAVCYVYGGVAEDLTGSGLFHVNDMIAEFVLCCSPALTTNMFTFSYYHDVVNLGGLVTQSYEFIAGEILNKGYLTTGGLFRGQAIKFRRVECDSDSAIGSP